MIAGKIGEKEQTVLYSRDKLINVGLVEKKKCITDKKNKKNTQYVLKDYMFKFWYEFIPKGTSVIEMGQGELYYQKAVKPILVILDIEQIYLEFECLVRLSFTNGKNMMVGHLVWGDRGVKFSVYNSLKLR